MARRKYGQSVGPNAEVLSTMVDFYARFLAGFLDDSEWPYWDEAVEEVKRILEQAPE